MSGLFNYQIPKKIKGKYTDAQKWNYYKSKTEPELYDQLYTASIPEDESSLLRTVREIKELFQEFKTKNKTITHKSSDVDYDTSDIHSIDEVGLPTEVKIDRIFKKNPEVKETLSYFMRKHIENKHNKGIQKDFQIAKTLNEISRNEGDNTEIFLTPSKRSNKIVGLAINTQKNSSDAGTTTEGGRGIGRPKLENLIMPKLYIEAKTPESYKEPKGISTQKERKQAAKRRGSF